MSSILDKLAAKEPTAEERAEMDASIREARRSVGARQLVTRVREGLARGLDPESLAADAEIAPLKEEFPKLFEMVCDPRCSPAMLTAMLAQLEAVEAGRKSTHDASVFVGTALVNSYVRPRLGMAPVPLPGSGGPAHRPSGPTTGGSR
jgi:hypothetical protein